MLSDAYVYWLPLMLAALVIPGCAATSRSLEEPSASAGLVSGERFYDALNDGTPGPAMIWLPSGKFIMGDLHGDGGFDELPQHKITMAKDVAMGVYELTVDEFSRFVAATGYVTDAERFDGCMVTGGKSWHAPKIEQTPDHPVSCVSWNDANAYTAWLSRETGQRYRLPTEAEWEYAARAGGEQRFPWGDAMRIDAANCWDCQSIPNIRGTTLVGAYAPNAFGLYDMAGNLWEWTASQWEPAYTGKEQEVSSLGPHENQRAIRGGGWFNGFPDTRVANRGNINPDWRYNTLGFRVLREQRR